MAAASASNGGNSGFPDPSQLFPQFFPQAGGNPNAGFPGFNGQAAPQQLPSFIPQQMPMGMFNMPGMQMPMYQQQPQPMQQPMAGAQGVMQVFTEIMKLNEPVGSSPDDEDILVRKLYESQAQNITYRSALESLHKVNNHGMGIWKDYYLEHKWRIDKLVEAHRPSSSRSVKEEKKHIKKRSSSPLRRQTIQKPSSREPVPPKHTECMADGRHKHKFTSEDRSKKSWRAYMSKKSAEEVQEVMDQVREEYRRDGRVGDISSDDDEEEEEEEHYSSDFYGSGDEDEDEDGSDDDDDDGSRYTESKESNEDRDIRLMSGPRERINDADRRVIARFIAKHDADDWDAAGASKSRWETFAEEHTQRSVAAWAESYRNHKDSIDEFVVRYRRQDANYSHKRPKSQTGIPSWAKKSSKGGTKKRKSDADYEHHHYAHKRSR
ncbi:hypothetical protein EIP91_005712 [Steccherinum ochraceum]|uniref:Uncharacterized protein n=1 Tax=Steccherinum ochraceum TaxID=92696 RepID=A0A4R0RZE3_9APHY|nr:hypothetical protein EIP91_005712 [Steccherinum ochraceum]